MKKISVRGSLPFNVVSLMVRKKRYSNFCIAVNLKYNYAQT